MRKTLAVALGSLALLMVPAPLRQPRVLTARAGGLIATVAIAQSLDPTTAHPVVILIPRTGD